MSRCLFVDINHCKYHFLLHFHPETECLEEKLEAADLLPHLQPSILTSVHGDNDGKTGTLPSNYEHNDCLITSRTSSLLQPQHQPSMLIMRQYCWLHLQILQHKKSLAKWAENDLWNVFMMICINQVGRWILNCFFVHFLGRENNWKAP